MAKFTQEEYEKAKEVNLVDYLQKNGYRLNKKGREYCLEEHDSLCINEEKNTWFWYSQNKGGGVIQFLQEYEGKTLVEAIYSLNNKSNTEHRAYTKYEPISIEKEKGELILPLKNEDNRRVQAYLSKSRGLDFEVINSLIKRELIYESKDKHEVVFLSKDKENNVKYASKRSTLTNNSFRQDVSNSDKQYGFKITGNSDKLFVFESPIDLLSHCTLSKMQGNDWKKDNRISLGGVSDVALKKFLEENQNIKEIVLLLDNDKTGIESANKICKKYGLDYKVNIFTSKYKDLNETLVKFKEEKFKNENIKLNDYIINLKNPFIEPKLKDTNSLENLSKILKEENILDNLFKNKIIAEAENGEFIIFIKNENKENIGGYKIDFENKNYFDVELIENSTKKIIDLNIDEDIKSKETLLLTDNIFLGATFTKNFQVGYINNCDNIILEDYLKQKDNVKNIILMFDNEKEFNKDFKEIFEKQDNIKECNNEIMEAIRNNVNKGTKIRINHLDRAILEKMIIKEEYIKKPFIPKEKGDNEELYKYLLENSSINKNKILELIKENHIYQDADRNMVFLVKNEKGENIGGYSLNIYDEKLELKLLDNSYISDIEKNEIINFANYIKNDLEIKDSEEQIEEFEQEIE